MPNPQFELALDLPENSEILSFQMQNGLLTVWIMQWEEATKKEQRIFRVFGTGQSIPLAYAYVGTVQDGPFVWHLMEIQ